MSGLVSFPVLLQLKQDKAGVQMFGKQRGKESTGVFVVSCEALVEADFLALGHCLCVNHSLVLLEDPLMTRWFSLDLHSSAERRKAGNISGGDQKGQRQRSARTHCMLKIWHTSSHTPAQFS